MWGPTHFFSAILLVLLALPGLGSAGRCKLDVQPRCNGHSVQYTVKRNGKLEPFYGYILPESPASQPLTTATYKSMVPVETPTGQNGHKGGEISYTVTPTPKNTPKATASNMVPVGSIVPEKDKPVVPLQARAGANWDAEEVLDGDENLRNHTLPASLKTGRGLSKDERFYVVSEVDFKDTGAKQGTPLAHDHFELCCDGPDEQCTSYKNHAEFAFCYNKDTYMFQLGNGARGSLENLEFTNLDGTEESFADLNLDFHYFAVNPPKEKETEETTEQTTARETTTYEITTSVATLLTTDIPASTTLRMDPEAGESNGSPEIQEKERLKNTVVKLVVGWLAFSFLSWP